MATDPRSHRQAPSPINAPRRRLLAAGLAAGAWPMLSLAATTTAARPDDPRFVFVILRGGMDGLSAVPAPGDPAFAAARGTLAEVPGSPALPLPGPLALHPALAVWSDNVRLLDSMAQAGLLSDVDAEALKQAYLLERAATHRLALAQQPLQVPAQDWAQTRERVQGIWQQLLGALV